MLTSLTNIRLSLSANYVHSLRSLSSESSIDYSKASSLQRAIYCFLFRIKISSLFVNVIRQPLTSSSSSSLPISISFNNAF